MYERYNIELKYNLQACLTRISEANECYTSRFLIPSYVKMYALTYSYINTNTNH